MMPKNNPISRMTIALCVAVVAAIWPGFSNGVRAQIEFNNPDDPIPVDTVGDLTNEADFQPPEDIGAPDDSVAGGTRGDLDFEPPEEGAPDDTSAGGVRGDDEDSSVRDLAAPDTTQIFDEVDFSLPDSLAPENSLLDSTDETHLSPENVSEEDVSPENVSEPNADESME